ncbi:replicase [Gregarina niphandrodes]|uniref:ATP-dependent helicase Rep n=1 Tax=Gregarina niphandrodes TaxID=110365 RepID=A0A023AX31_GRENI|nr:replicase [Gregarina niphandrodes]EZG42785.1 replicase [Gregarina niphandrodes]|eukprot:XP_011133935.1 replicase [Gregarina niphandrodes]
MPGQHHQPRGRAFCFTAFYDTPPTIIGYQYIIYQREICPSTGTLHWQGFIYFTNPRSFNAVKQLMGGLTHIEFAMDIPKSIEYCKKQETAVPDTQFEDGTPPPSALPPGWWQQLTIQSLWEDHPEWMLKHYAGVLAYHKTKKVVKFARQKPNVTILWGPPGTGKSHLARSLSDDYYIKPSGPWWDGYHGQNTVIFDDFYSSEKYCDLLRWLSENPIRVPIKGSTTDLEATNFIFTSNQNPDSWYPQIEDKSALKRRITEIIHMETPYCSE